MRFIWMAALALLVTVNVSGLAQATIAGGQAAAAPVSQAASLPALPKEPAEIFKAAAPLYDFASPSLKPWHMKVSYQLYDEKGNPTDKGSYEYWWAKPDRYRSTWKRDGVEWTEWKVEGKDYQLTKGPALEFFERKLQSDFLAPLPNAEDLNPEIVRLDKQDQKFGAVKLPCVMVIRKMPLSSKQLQVVPLGMFPTYCFDPSAPMVRATYSFGSTEVIYNRIARFQGMFLPQDLTVMEGSRKVLTATVDLVQGLPANSEALTPMKDAVALDYARKIEVSGAVAAGSLLTKVPPVYPQDAKDAHIEGTVRLRALIGTDGHIHDLSVLEGPSPSLIGASLWAVSRWIYKPYILNGGPVNVDTTITCVFRLGSPF